MKMLWFYVLCLFAWERSACELIDLSYPITDDETVHPKYKKFERKVDLEVEQPPPQGVPIGYWVSVYSITLSEHTGTHLDAPYHMNEMGWKLEEIPMDYLIQVNAVLINVTDKVFVDNKWLPYVVTKQDIVKFEKEHGQIPPKSIVLLMTGWGERWADEVNYYGRKGGCCNYPGLDVSAAKFLTMERGVIGIGIDGPTIDSGNSKTNPTERHLASRNVFSLVNLANLHLLPATNFVVWVMPMKFDRGAAAPARVVADVSNLIHRDRVPMVTRRRLSVVA